MQPRDDVTITPEKVNGTIYAGDPVAAAAKNDMATAYSTALAQGPDAPLDGGLGGMTLTPGLYSFGAAATLGGTLTLNGGGDPNAVFIFQVGSTIAQTATAILDAFSVSDPNVPRRRCEKAETGFPDVTHRSDGIS